MPKINPIKIAHIHVWDKKNKGDFAIVLAVQELLRQRFKGCVILDFPLTVLKSGTERDAEKINDADLVVIGGGGVFYSYFLPFNIKFVDRIKIPIILFGLGYIREIGSPELSPKAIESAVYLADKAKAIGVRDNNTKIFLSDNGISPRRVKVIGDPSILLSEERPSVGKFKFLGKKNVGRKNKKSTPIRIGLNLNYSGWLGFGKWRKEILGAYREAVEYFMENYAGSEGPGVEIYYLKHHPGEKNIYPELKIKGLKIVDLKPSEQKYLYGRLDLVIGMMLHSGVLSFGAGTPEISVAYDLRNYSFAEFIGCPELVVDLDKLEKGVLMERAKNVFEKKNFYRRIFLEKKNKIGMKLKNFLAEIEL